MKSTEELRNLYDTDLKEQLESMEKRRKQIKYMWRIGTILAILLFLFFPRENTTIIQFVVSGLAFLLMLFMFGKGVVRYFSYRKDFKQEVVTKVVKLINPDYHYNPNQHISLEDFKRSLIFDKNANRCLGDDFIAGTIEQTDFKFSELKVSEQREVKENDQRKIETDTIFKGLFFHADFNKHLQSSTFVFPDRAEKLLGKFGQNLQKNSDKGELVKLENPEFEKEFVVYGSQQEARYVLTPTMMEAMVLIRQKYKQKMYFSFTGERVYCAIRFKKALFEPRIRKSGVNFEDVEHMYLLFGLIATIIHEMNLNTRIWTKE